MQESLTKSVPKGAGHGKSVPPNWDLVPFNVACARCGHDLHGRSEPKCPACDLAFDWADAVPLEQLTCRYCGYHLYGLQETRCPECGESFTWEQALDDHHRREQPFFEYQWRPHPIRSFVRTWYWALRPRTLWTKLDIHDPPQIGPLLLMVGIILVGSLALLGISNGLEDWLAGRSAGGLRGNPFATPWLPQAPTIEELPTYMLRALLSFRTFNFGYPVAVWMVCSFLALLVFQQSMRLCKVRTAHVVRVCCYALPMTIPIVTALVFVPRYINAVAGSSVFAEAGLIAVLAVLAHATWSIHVAYRSYLRMPHAAAVALTSQLMALLAFASADWLLQGRIAARILVRILEFFGWW